MSVRHIFLDSLPLGLLSHPRPSLDILNWSLACRAAGHILYMPEVIDYEILRELLRAGKTVGVQRLDALKLTFEYLEITTNAMLLAAELWSQSRRSGFLTAHPKALDVDVILVAQELTCGVPIDDIVIATSNIGHLSRFGVADLWTNIHP